MSETLMPAAFIGHGNPMNALERNRYTQAWRAFGASVPKPRAVLVVHVTLPKFALANFIEQGTRGSGHCPP